MKPDGVVVTGVGCISALGIGLETSMAAMFRGQVQPVRLAQVDTSLEKPPAVFGVVDPLLEADDPMRTRTTRLGITAAAAAVHDAWGGRQIGVQPTRIGVCMGTTVGSTFNEEPFYIQYVAGKNPEPTAIKRYLTNDLSRSVAAHFGALGLQMTIANACASSADAIGLAKMWLECGLCDVVIAGGADELARLPFLGFWSLKNSSSERCKPFDKDRKGLNLGEGAGVMILEKEQAALRRSAPILARIEGYASAADAYHMTAPHPEGRGLRRALDVALAGAEIEPQSIGLVNAHGTGTQENDRIEGQALADLVSAGTPVLSTKGFTGHTLGAAGVLEAIFCVGCLAAERSPANAGFSTADPECVLVPTTEVQPIERPYAVSNSLAFGGTNSVVVLSREGLS